VRDAATTALRAGKRALPPKLLLCKHWPGKHCPASTARQAMPDKHWPGKRWLDKRFESTTAAKPRAFTRPCPPIPPWCHSQCPAAELKPASCPLSSYFASIRTPPFRKKAHLDQLSPI